MKGILQGESKYGDGTNYVATKPKKKSRYCIGEKLWEKGKFIERRTEKDHYELGERKSQG